MYRKQKMAETMMEVNTTVEGETIEQKINRIVNNKEPITDGAPIIYMERGEGINPGMDIRTDRWEVAVEAMDKVTKAHLAKREERMKAVKGGKQEGGQGEGKEGKA